jgi:exosortase
VLLSQVAPRKGNRRTLLEAAARFYRGRTDSTHRTHAALVVLLFTAFLYRYRRVLSILVSQWATNDLYSYGFLIPPISLYLVWQRRDLLRAALPGSSPVLGMLVFLVGLGLLVLGQRVDIVGIQELSLLPTLVGLVLIAAGSGALRVVWFPTVYLLAMFPVWEVFTERLHYPFQQISADVGASLLRLSGVPVHHEGVYLQLPNVTLEVARVCSGVNYLIAITAIGVPLAYTAFADQLRRCLLVCFGLLVAILANPLRVGLIGFTSYYGSSTNIHGPGHVFRGMFVAIVGYVALFSGARLLSWWGSLRPADLGEPLAHQAVSSSPNARATRPRRGWVAVTVAGAFLLVTGTMRPPVFGVVESSMIAELPDRIGMWHRVNQPTAPTAQMPTQGLLRLYRTSQGQNAELYLGSAVGDPDDSTGKYWTALVDLGGLPLRLGLEDGKIVTVNRAMRSEGVKQRLIVYWYDVDGTVYLHRTAAKFITFWRRVTGFNRPPSLVVVSCPTDGESEAAASAALLDLARHLVMVLSQKPE